MGLFHSRPNPIETFNTNFAKPPNDVKSYEKIVYDYLFSTYRMFTQSELYDFYLPDYDIYIEVDEEHHFGSCKSQKQIKNARGDNAKILKCLAKPSTLIRLSWFCVSNGTFKDVIKYCINKNLQGKLLLSSREIYENLDMLHGVNKRNIVYYS